MLMVYLTLLFLSFAIFERANGHGYQLEPAGRSTLWRHNDRFPNAPINYDDNALNCGGFGDQWFNNNGKCGICGDPYEQPKPRNNEEGGTYGQDIIAATYKAGQKVDVTIVITVNHHGWFEFRLCNDTNRMKVEPQRCLNDHLLELADGSGTRYHITQDESQFTTVIGVKLPQNVYCSQCVMQWHYHTASNWGFCRNGVGRLGCGPQETFRACSDITINK